MYVDASLYSHGDDFMVGNGVKVFLNTLQSDSSAAREVIVPPKAVSSAEAANQWLQSAHAEVSGSQSANTPLAVSASFLSPLYISPSPCHIALIDHWSTFLLITTIQITFTLSHNPHGSLEHRPSSHHYTYHLHLVT